MGTKVEELVKAAQGQGCLGKADPLEPLFILRAQDLHAPALVEAWASMAARSGCAPEKVAEAMALANKMRAWPNRKNPD